MAKAANLKVAPEPATTPMAQEVTDQYGVFNADCMDVLRTLPSESIGLSVYSPPFPGGSGNGLYVYSSDDRDMSNSTTYEQFLEHYAFIVEQVARVTKPGRMSAVHCMDTPLPGQFLRDFPGDVIRLHAKYGFGFHARYAIWKEPLRVAIRTRSKGLMHRQIVLDSTLTGNAGADYVLVFRKEGENKEPVAHPTGLSYYPGAREIPEGFVEKFRDWKDPKTNKLSHWIFQQLASSIWDDVRINRVLQYKAARDKDDTRHVHPLQLDVIERCVILFSNPGDTVLSPFAGVGSEVYGALRHGRKAIGIELKRSYWNQLVKNIQSAAGSLERPELQVAFNLGDTEAEMPEDEGDLGAED